jgi:hypothetical protein
MMKSKYQSGRMLKPVPSTTFGDSWDYDHDVSTTTGSQADSLATSPSFDWSASSTALTKLVQVSVTGVIFKIDSVVFNKLKRLPWECSSTDNCLFLPTSPDLFEILLNHLIFESFPIVLKKTDIEELEPMAIVLGLHKLESHLTMLNKHTHWGNRSRRQVVPVTTKIMDPLGRTKFPSKANTVGGSSRHWEIARDFFIQKKYRTVHDQAMLNAECLSQVV